MRRAFRSIDDVLGAPIWEQAQAFQPTGAGQNRVLKATRLEDMVYQDLCRDDGELDELVRECTPRLSTFPDLARDIYQSFYSLNVRKRPEEELSGLARRFNGHILQHMMDTDEYPTIKSVCEGRKLPAYDAAGEFTEHIAHDLDDLLKDVGGEKKSLDVLDKLEQKRDESLETLQKLLERRRDSAPDAQLDARIVKAANTAQSQCRQADEVGRMVRDNLLKNSDQIAGLVAGAMKAAQEKGEETAAALAAWGTGDTESGPEQMKLDMEVLERVRRSQTLMTITRHLGRFKEMLAQARKNGFAYSRGEKYTLELGGDMSRALTSEFSLLALPETIPLFLRKLQRRSLKQYRRREAIHKGCGDIICMLDESGSAKGDAPWAKAVAFTLLDAAMEGGRKFAIVHFSSHNQHKTDLFLPGQYTREDVFAAAETFLGGNTSYETPLREALRLMEEADFQKADLVFVTDGACALSDSFQEQLRERKKAEPFTITGVLLDMAQPGFSFSLESFCDDVYRTSQLAGDEIVRSLIGLRI